MIDAVLNIGGKLIDRLWQDPDKKAQAQLELFKLQQSGELQVIAAQLEINKIEAASPSTFVAGWRPAMGWVCVLAFATQFLIGPIGTWVAMLFGKLLTFPTLSLNELMPILLGMLGLVGARSFEKVNGVAAK